VRWKLPKGERAVDAQWLLIMAAHWFSVPLLLIQQLLSRANFIATFAKIAINTSPHSSGATDQSGSIINPKINAQQLILLHFI
jgi:hypothetical protein